MNIVGTTLADQETLLEISRRLNALYVCPKEHRVRKGPLVVYNGKDSRDRNFVGDIYFNFRKIEPHLNAVGAFATAVLEKLQKQGLLDAFDTICGIPQGGRTFGQELARISGKKFAYADKKPKLTEAGKKQEYTWDLSQFDFEAGERLAVTDDIANNFGNTDHLLDKLTGTGARVVVLVYALNRSPVYDTTYKGLPVVASIREAYPEYEQDDPEVAADVTAGNVEFDVKNNWARLRAAMQS